MSKPTSEELRRKLEEQMRESDSSDFIAAPIKKEFRNKESNTASKEKSESKKNASSSKEGGDKENVTSKSKKTNNNSKGDDILRAAAEKFPIDENSVQIVKTTAMYPEAFELLTQLAHHFRKSRAKIVMTALSHLYHSLPENEQKAIKKIEFTEKEGKRTKSII